MMFISIFGNSTRKSLTMLSKEPISEGYQTGYSGPGSAQKYKSFINNWNLKGSKNKGQYNLRTKPKKSN